MANDNPPLTINIRVIDIATDVTIRSCASIIMQAMQAGIAVDTKQYNSATIREAYKLLMFEQIITRQSGYTLTETGRKHIAKNGFEVYKSVIKETK